MQLFMFSLLNTCCRNSENLSLLPYDEPSSPQAVSNAISRLLSFTLPSRSRFTIVRDLDSRSLSLTYLSMYVTITGRARALRNLAHCTFNFVDLPSSFIEIN